MKNKILLYSTALTILFAPLNLSASETTERCDSGMRGVDCKLVRTKLRSGDWGTDQDMYYFRSTKDRYCKINAHLNSSKNARFIFTHTSSGSNGEWAISGLKVAQDKKGKPWNYSIGWDINCKKRRGY